MAFTLFKRENSCPACQSSDGRCKETEEGLILCMASLDSDEIPGYRNRGRSRNGTWVILTPKQDDWSERQRQDWRAEIAIKRQQRKQQEDQHRTKSLSNEERHRFYSPLVAQLDLEPQDREDLARRLRAIDTPEEEIPQLIQDSGFKSVPKGHKLREPLPHPLPGVSLDGRSLSTQAGLFIPVKNFDQQIIGYQTRLRDNSNGRYRWGSSSSKKRPNGPKPNLANGELPLAVYFPLTTPTHTELAEGLGHKPFANSIRTSGIIIGAAGAQWSSSPEQLRESLDRSSRMTGSNLVIINPDAGAIHNPAILRQYYKTAQLIEAWGYEVRFRWWGQYTKDTKDCGDIDEIDSATFASARLLTIAEFKALAPQQEAEIEKLNQLLRSTYSQAKQKRPRKQGFGNQRTQSVQPPQGAPECVAIVPYNSQQNGRYDLLVTPNTLPTFEEWKQQGRPRLRYQTRDRLEVALKLVEYEYPIVLISDIVGSGKSQFAGEFLQALAQHYPERRGFYTSTDYRNPSTEPLAAIPEAVSAGGLIYDRSKQTPTGEPYRKRAAKGQVPDIPALCIEDDNIQALRAKGVDTYRGLNSAYCQDCSQFRNCSYLIEKAKQQTKPILRTHLSSSRPKKGDLLLIDEAGRDIKGTRTIEACIEELDRELQLIQSKSELYESGRVILERLAKTLQRGVAERGRYGVDHLTLLKFLPSKEELEQLWWEAIAYNWLNTDSPWEVMSLHQYGQEIRKLVQPSFEQAFTGPQASEIRQQIADKFFTAGIFPKLIGAILGTYRGSIGITAQGKLTFTHRSSHHAAIVRQAGTAFLMDGTPDLQAQARQLGLRATDICQIQAESPRFPNLKIKLVQRFGQARHQRRQDGPDCLMERLNRLLDSIIQQVPHPDRVAVLDLKRYAYSYLEQHPEILVGHHFADNRNSNRFKNCSTLISIPLAIPNLGQLLAEWQALTREFFSLEEASGPFWSWVNQQIIHELLQDIGRSRAQHRPQEEITHWIVSELNPNQIRAIQDYYVGCSIEFVDISELCLEAAPRGIQTKQGIIMAMEEALRIQGDITIQQVATTVGVSKGRVSQITKEFGGFKELKASLVLLLEAINNETKLSDLDESLQWLAQTYLPALAVDLSQEQSAQLVHERFVQLLEDFEPESFRQILIETPCATLMKLFSGFLTLLPQWMPLRLWKKRSPTVEPNFPIA
ncbi:hypothetical protein [Trichocoleus sp. FACHB-262]|uniref:hypothetical protein n=1 Tax=Trichocoleus sp. FACHB-262 TaxID=2692869 RepID=UPI0016867A71|nr:hypothetical protein [Trichocoleus sp. FACHB-262]MBD2124229.1 hypothetical protein [Trichocoleus sp. FACHB-262]